MKISGYICASNVVLRDYSFREAALSLLPVCDELVLSIGPSEDQTMEIAKALVESDSRVRILEYPLHMPVRDIHWWTKHLNWTRERLTHPMQLTLDADEVLYPRSYQPIRDAAKNGECRWFQRYNFWGDTKHTAPHGRVCGEQVARLGPTSLWMPSDEPHPEGEPEIRMRAGWPPNAHDDMAIAHLGFLRKPEAFFGKVRAVNGAFFGSYDERLERAEKEGVHWSTYCPFDIPLLDHPGDIPEVAHQWLRDRNHMPPLEMVLHNENPKLDAYARITEQAVAELADTDYFQCGTSPACVAILPFVKSDHHGVEIGVFRGNSSTVFLDHCAHMHFIDPCVEYDDYPDKGWACQEKPFLKLLEPYAGRFTFIKGFSGAVSGQIPMVDFVFLDGNHSYKYVMGDCELYWPKIKPGGFLCGHDYNAGHPGVNQAVDEFFTKLGLRVEQHQYCWLVWKPL